MFFFKIGKLLHLIKILVTIKNVLLFKWNFGSLFANDLLFGNDSPFEICLQADFYSSYMKFVRFSKSSF